MLAKSQLGTGANWDVSRARPRVRSRSITSIHTREPGPTPCWVGPGSRWIHIRMRERLVLDDLGDGTGGAGVLASAAGILVGNGGDVVQLDSCDCSFSKKARSPSRDKNNVIHLSVSFKSFYQTPTVGHQGFLSYPKIRHSLMEKNSGRIRFPVTRSISSVIRKGSIV